MTDAVANLSPFKVLFDYERLSLDHAANLPEQLEAAGIWRGIGFRIGEHRLAGNIADINEIMTVPSVTLIPGARPWLLGLANVRGNLVTLVDLRGFLDGHRTPINERSRVLVVRHAGSLVGLLVDELFGQKNFPDEQKVDREIDEASGIRQFVIQSYLQGEQVWSVFSLAGLIRAPEFSQAAV